MNTGRNVSLWIGLRYSTARDRDSFGSFISLVSVIGLILGVVALTTVVSVMNGFDRELKKRILGVIPHAVVYPANRSLESDAPDIMKVLAGDSRVRVSVPFLEVQGMITNGTSVNVVSIHGIVPDREQEVSIIPGHLVAGSLQDLLSPSSIIVGSALARRLGLMIGDDLVLIVPDAPDNGDMVVPRLARLRLAGIFEVGSEIDSKLALMQLDQLSAVVTSPAGVRLALYDLFSAGRVVEELTKRYGAAIRTVDWTEEYGDLFATVRMEKSMMFLLLLVVVIIASINIVSSLSIFVDEKKSDVAILRTLGCSPTDILLVFIVQGGVIGLAGTAIGIALGVPLAYNISEIVSLIEGVFGSKLLEGTYFDTVPSEVRYIDVAIIAFAALSISTLASIYPALRASRLEPADVLKYE